MKSLMIGLMMATIGGGAMAATWEKGENKGLVVYRAIGQGIEATMVCDPDKVMDPPERHLTFKIGGQEKTGKYMVSGGGKSATAHLDYGTAMDADLAAIIDVLKSAAAVDVSVDGKSYRIETDQPFSGSCGE